MSPEQLELEKKLTAAVLANNQSHYKILQLVEELPNAGNDCNCDDCERYDWVMDGSFGAEIMSICVNCGGYVYIH